APCSRRSSTPPPRPPRPAKVGYSRRETTGSTCWPLPATGPASSWAPPCLLGKAPPDTSWRRVNRWPSLLGPTTLEPPRAWAPCSTVADPSAPRPAFARESAAVRLSEVVSLSDLSPEWAWGGATGRGVRVAVVDSGIEAGHPSLEGCVDEAQGLAVTLDEAGEAVDVPGPHDDSF